MRPLKFMWNFGVKFPAKVAGALVGMELRGWSEEKLIAWTKQQHEAAGDIGDVLPPTFQSGGVVGAGVYGRDHVPIDIDGSVLSIVRSVRPVFVSELKNLEPGLVLVTARIEPDSRGVRDIAAYVKGRHVGWIESLIPFIRKEDWDWIKELNRKGYLPRFKGFLSERRDGSRYVAFLMPKRMEWARTAPQLRYLHPRPAETTREWLDRMKRENKEGQEGS